MAKKKIITKQEDFGKPAAMTAEQVAKELNAIIANGTLAGEDFDVNEFANDDLEDDAKKEIEAKLGKWSEVDDDDTRYDRDDETRVFKFGNNFVALSGYYDSQNGSDFSDAEFYAVKPVRKTVTVYEATKTKK